MPTNSSLTKLSRSSSTEEIIVSEHLADLRNRIRLLTWVSGLGWLSVAFLGGAAGHRNSRLVNAFRRFRDATGARTGSVGIVGVDALAATDCPPSYSPFRSLPGKSCRTAVPRPE